MAGSNELVVRLVGDTKDLERALSRGAKSSQSSFRKIGRAAGIAGAAIATGLAVVAKRGWDELAESQKVMAQTQAVIKSTGGVAKMSADEIVNLAERLSELSGVDDEVIQSGENMLLTFKGIRDEAGKGNDIFTQATEATLDFAVAMKKDVPDAALMVGKALNMPLKGVTKLEKVGVQFTDAQKKLIAKLVETGDVAGAQKIILKELEDQFGGSAKAAGDTLPGKLDKLKNKFDEVSGQLIEKLIPHLETLLDKLEAVITWAEENPSKVRNIAIAFGVLAGALTLAAVATTLLNLAVLANPFVAGTVAIVGFIAIIVVLARKFDFVRDHWHLLLFAFGLLPGVVAVIIRNWDTLKSKGQTVFRAIRGFVQGVRDAIQTVIDKVGALINRVKDLPGMRGFIRALIGPFNALLGAVTGVIGAVKDLIGWIRAIPDIGTQVPGGRPPVSPGSRPRGSNPNLAVGGDIMRGGLARLHTGERVLPARVANRGLHGSGGEVKVIVVGGDREAVNYLRRLLQDDGRRNGRPGFAV